MMAKMRNLFQHVLNSGRTTDHTQATSKFTSKWCTINTHRLRTSRTLILAFLQRLSSLRTGTRMRMVSGSPPRCPTLLVSLLLAVASGQGPAS